MDKSLRSDEAPCNRISVCLATYNGDRYLREQIDSILPQLLPGDELLVSDDGSNDATIAILGSYGTRLKLVDNSRAGGVVANFSRVLGYASGDFILLADQDDVWLPGRVEVMRQALMHYDLVLTNAWVVDAELNSSGVTLFDQVRPRLGFWRNLAKNSFVGCCIGVRSSLVRRAVPIPANSPWHDWLLGLLASCNQGRVKLLDAPLLLYRRHGQNASPTGQRSTNSLMRKLVLRWQILAAVLRCLHRPATDVRQAR